jgi:hypothetical protein
MNNNIKFITSLFLVFGVSMAIYALYSEIKNIKEDIKYIKRQTLTEYEDCEFEEDPEEDDDEHLEDITEEEQEADREWKKSLFEKYMHPHEEPYMIHMEPIEEEPEEEAHTPSPITEMPTQETLLEAFHQKQSLEEDTKTHLEQVASDIKANLEKEKRKYKKRAKKVEEPIMEPIDLSEDL